MIDNFPLLAIETSGELCSIALFLDKNCYSEINLLKKHVHSEKLIGLIDQALNSLDISSNDLQAIAVSMGPGSFTGLRIGLSVAKGIGMGNDLPIIPVPTFDALAYKLSEFISVDQKFVIANKVNIDEVYLAQFQTTTNGFDCVEEIRVADRDELDQFRKNNLTIYSDSEQIGKLAVITALAIGKWAYIFGEDLLTFEYDYLEPNYLKQFKVRRIK